MHFVVYNDRMTYKRYMAKSNFLSLDSLSLQDFDENSELIPLMTPEDEAEINNEALPKTPKPQNPKTPNK